MKLITIALIQSIIIASGQITLKLGLIKFGTFDWTWRFWRTVVLNVPLIASGIMMIVGTLLWMWMVKTFPLSMLLPLQTLGYVLGILASMIIFHENVSYTQWGGMALIMTGCLLIGK